MRGTRTAHARLLAPVGATLLIAGAVALAAGPVVADTAASSRVARAAPFDLDGDGHGEPATFGTPSAGVEQATGRVRGTSSGASPRPARRLLSPGRPRGFPASARTGTTSGRSVTSGDFDGDGHADLSIGATRARTGSPTGPRRAPVTVLRGTASGVSGRGQPALIRASDVRRP